MQVTQTSFTIAEYCDQMLSGSIIINRDYQRSPRVWPAAARSYLLETILLGYPIPKICLYQKTDPKSRKTVKEIVDGQQRSSTISEFFNDKFRITGSGPFGGKTYSQLDESDQSKLLNYSLGTDVFVGATDQEVREVFRRMNSYTVPLNRQERRHATNQGELKWMIVELCNKYSDPFKTMGVFGERQFARMLDGALFSEFFLAIDSGIQSAADKKLDDLYTKYETQFEKKTEWSGRIIDALAEMQSLSDIHQTPIMKPYNVLTLLLAFSHIARTVPALAKSGNPGGVGIDRERAVVELSALSDVLENGVSDESPEKHKDFFEACSKATNRINQRQVRFDVFCDAIAMQ